MLTETGGHPVISSCHEAQGHTVPSLGIAEGQWLLRPPPPLQAAAWAPRGARTEAQQLHLCSFLGAKVDLGAGGPDPV